MERSDLELVLAVRDHGSLTAAASVLDVAPSVVTKRLAALEARLGQRLFQRTTRRVSPTAEGDILCARAATLLRGFTELEAELQERHAEPTGPIRLAATFGFGRVWLGPALAAFQAHYPRVQIQLQLTEQLPDLAVEGYDGAVWLWSVPNRRASEWVARRLARNQRVLAASPAYLKQHGMPMAPADLQHHDCLIVRENGNIGEDRYDTWSLQHEKTRITTRVRIQGPLASNSGELVRDWCLAGRGIMLRSLWDIAPLLDSGQLQRVLPACAMIDADIHWLAPYRTRTPKRIRLLIDFLADHLRHEPWKISSPGGLAAPRGSRHKQ